MTDSLEIQRLTADSPHLMTIATWQHEQWGHLEPETSFNAGYEQLRTQCGSRGVPSVFMVMHDRYPVATASLVEHDMRIRQELTPWLASVFVLPAYRGQGIASRLVRRVEREAHDAGLTHFYLFTPDQQALYRRLGWNAHENLTYQGVAVTLMNRELVARA